MRRDAAPGLVAPPTPERAASAPAPTGAVRPAESPPRGSRLRRLLVTFDLVGFAVAWAVALILPLDVLGARPTTLGLGLTEVLVATAIGVGAMLVQRLYLARVCSVRAVELSRTARAAVSSAVLVGLTGHWAGRPVGVARLVIGAAVAFLIVAMLRGVYASLIRERRARGLHRRPIVIIGTNDEARELAQLVRTHPEFGYEPVGVIGRLDEYQRWPAEIPYLGTADEASDVVANVGANGVLIAASALSPAELKRVTREFLRDDLHVHISSGLWGIDHRRLRSVPLAHEPLFYLEPVSLSRTNQIVKRILDLALGSIALVLAAPVMLIAAIAIKLGDGGPVFFRQVRVGKDGRHITVLKLRTMVPDAEELLTDVARANGNLRDSVLFKLEDDPRLTRVGRILEAASIDELPQLFNVLRGSMSLVGPRPALPAEVAQFDDELLERLSVPPGMTGLWQVEARDNPSFQAYRRLDLFYVENWSVTLDLAILWETVSSVLGRLARGRR